MAKYKEKKSLKKVEAILYTGDNIEEIKELLGGCFMGVAPCGEHDLVYRPTMGSTLGEDLFALKDMLVKYPDGSFEAICKDDFLAEWEEVE